MRVPAFSDVLDTLAYNAALFWDGAARGTQNTVAGAWKKQRDVMHTYRTRHLDPALAELRLFRNGTRAHVHDAAFGALRRGNDDPATLSRKLDELAVAVNTDLAALATTQSQAYLRFTGVVAALPDIAERDLKAYHSAFLPGTWHQPTVLFKGWMTRDACDDIGADDYPIVYKIFAAGRSGGAPDGERGAPPTGYTHIHVNGDANRCVSYEGGQVIGFTGHMDNTSPGRAQSAAAKRMKDDAVANGWVWVAFEKTPTSALRLVRVTV